MTATVERLLKNLQNAVGARALYPAEHPRTIEGIERIEREVRELTASDPEVAVFAVDDKVVHEGSALPGSEPLARGLFRILRTHGYDRLTIKRAVTREEIDTFIQSLADAARRAELPPLSALKPSANIRLSTFKQARPAEKKAHLAVEDFLQEETKALGTVWDGVVGRRELDMGAVQGIVVALASTIEENLGAIIPMASLKSHDEYTATHIINVALLAMALSEALGLPEETVHDIGIAALLHDVGKLQVPAAILNKPGSLTEAEFDLIKRHPDDGARILFSTPGVPEIAVIVAYEHHIRFDGGGYPTVGAAWRMNLASAITQIADIYDALRTDRPYRQGLDREDILGLMTSAEGSHFDPELLRAFFTRVIPKAALG